MFLVLQVLQHRTASDRSNTGIKGSKPPRLSFFCVVLCRYRPCDDSSTLGFLSITQLIEGNRNIHIVDDEEERNCHRFI